MRKKRGFIETSSVKSKPERSKADFNSTLSISCLTLNSTTISQNCQGFFKKHALKGKKGVKMSKGINKDDLNDFKRLLKRFKRGIIDALSKIFNRAYAVPPSSHYLKFQKKRR